VGLVGVLGVDDDDVGLAGSAFLGNENESDLAAPPFPRLEDGSVVQDITLTQSIDAAERQPLTARLDLEVDRAERGAGRAGGERRRDRDSGGWIRPSCLVGLRRLRRYKKRQGQEQEHGDTGAHPFQYIGGAPADSLAYKNLYVKLMHPMLCSTKRRRTQR
jgi:hypothetical protein